MYKYLKRGVFLKNIYLLRIKDEFLTFFYGENKSIYMQQKSGEKLVTTKIIENVLDCFSVSIYFDKIYIICQDFFGSLKLLVSNGNSFSQVELFKDSLIPKRAIFTPLFLGNNISFIFNTFDSRQNFISVKTLVENKYFTQTENIDYFYPNYNLFEVQKQGDDLIIVYQKRDKEAQLGYKLISNGKISDFIPFHKTGHQIVDFSFISFNNCLHFIFIVKNLFSTQVIYRKFENNSFSNPVVLYDGQKVRDCTIFIIDNILYCTYISNFNLFYSTSKDFGNSFNTNLKHKKPFSSEIIKASFLCDKPSNFSINHVYVDFKNPLNIQFLPDISQQFNNISNFEPIALNGTKFISDFSNQILNTTQKNNTQNLTSDNLNNNLITTENKNYSVVNNESDFMNQFDTKAFEHILKNKSDTFFKAQNIANNKQQNKDDIKVNISEDISLAGDSAIEFIKNKLDIANEELTYKNSEIIKLNNLLQQIKQEKNSIEIQLRKKIKDLENSLNKDFNNTTLTESDDDNAKNNIKSVENNTPDNN